MIILFSTFYRDIQTALHVKDKQAWQARINFIWTLVTLYFTLICLRCGALCYAVEIDAVGRYLPLDLIISFVYTAGFHSQLLYLTFIPVLSSVPAMNHLVYRVDHTELWMLLDGRILRPIAAYLDRCCPLEERTAIKELTFRDRLKHKTKCLAASCKLVVKLLWNDKKSVGIFDIKVSNETPRKRFALCPRGGAVNSSICVWIVLEMSVQLFLQYGMFKSKCNKLRAS